MDPNRGNQVRPVEEMLGEGGMNTVRLRFVANGYLTSYVLTFTRRLWVNPSNGLYGLNYNLELARRFRQKGFSIYLDFHFRYARKR